MYFGGTLTAPPYSVQRTQRPNSRAQSKADAAQKQTKHIITRGSATWIYHVIYDYIRRSPIISPSVLCWQIIRMIPSETCIADQISTYAWHTYWQTNTVNKIRIAAVHFVLLFDCGTQTMQYSSRTLQYIPDWCFNDFIVEYFPSALWALANGWNFVYVRCRLP